MMTIRLPFQGSITITPHDDVEGRIRVVAKGDQAKIIAICAAGGFCGIPSGFGIYSTTADLKEIGFQDDQSHIIPEASIIIVTRVDLSMQREGEEIFQIESFEGFLQAFDSTIAVLIPNLAVQCSSSTIGVQERFRFIDLGSGEFAMQAANGKFVMVDLNNGGFLEACADSVQDWEKFSLVNHDDGTLLIRSRITGKFVCADQNRGQLLIADRDEPLDWERFRIIIL